MEQTKITEPSDLLDENGELKQVGWATQLILKYEREKVSAGSLRIKEWDCYEIYNEEFGLALIIADVGYFGMATLDFMDFKNNVIKGDRAVSFFTRGSLNMPPSTMAGITNFAKKNKKMKFERIGDDMILTFDFPDFWEGKGIKGEIKLDMDPKRDTLVNVIPFENKKQFVYVQKIVDMPVNGKFTIGGEEYTFSDENGSFGVIDWTRAVFPYKTSWYWGGGFGIVNGKRLGFNLDRGFGIETISSKNMIFYEGKGHKIADIMFHYDKKDIMKPWKFTSSDGRFEMILDPVMQKGNNMNALVLKTSGVQVLGYFIGDLILDDGTKIHIDKADKVFGWAENFSHKW